MATQTTTIDTVVPQILSKREEAKRSPVLQTAKSVPTYASACSGEARYRTACDCYGATASTVTLPTPVVTVTATATAVVTVAPPPPALFNPCPGLLYSNPQCCATDVLGIVPLNCAARKSRKFHEERVRN